MENLREFADRILADGGATHNFAHGSSPESGYVVANGIDEETFELTGPLDAIRRIGEYVKKHVETLIDDEGEVGGWIDEGKVYLDLVDVLSDLRTAVLLGLRRNQLAIYDLNKGKDIPLPQHRQTAGTYTQQAMYLELLADQVVKQQMSV